MSPSRASSSSQTKLLSMSSGSSDPFTRSIIINSLCTKPPNVCFDEFIPHAMAVSPQPSLQDGPIDFRAPPPSPVASGRRSCVTNDDVITEFLQSSLRVPDLVLPDKIFPRQRFIDNPSVIDIRSLRDGGSRREAALRMLDSIARVGCFQLVEFGISRELLLKAVNAAGGVFEVSSLGRDSVTRSAERFLGFEEVPVEEEESESAEEFVWCDDKGLNLDLERVWPKGFSNFREKMIWMNSELDKVAETIFSALWENSLKLMCKDDDLTVEERCGGSMLCIVKHRPSLETDRLASSLRYDIIKMMIRGADYSHALCLHVLNGASQFHVYSKKGWVLFCPEKDSIIVTVGDRFQALSGGQYRHVIGRPVFEGGSKDSVSIGLLYLPPQLPLAKEKMASQITVGQQAMIAVVLTLVYHFVVYMFKNLGDT
ncbi:hypothetical protein MLD38_007921 [Melastoma candidum]|uniref:Uncharacterized protein n=1 Tax=Melastoma candidum TaxID=119954 RepID=A0ACB9RSM5_9MYRT|nr:hypothetical protein MLD38_007921 [Melastoma candidum]